ncbi:MAG: FIST N-terminal domain-containing protein [Pseudomonadota bacterium]
MDAPFDDGIAPAGDGATLPVAPRGALLSASLDAGDAVGAMPALAARLMAEAGAGGLALVVLFVARAADWDRVAEAAGAAFGAVPVIGCSTAGEIGPGGYEEGTVVAIGLPRRDFAAAVRLLAPLAPLDTGAVAGAVLSARLEVATAAPDWGHAFAMLMVDGMSRAEDRLVAAIAPALGPVAMFGGSAGDGLEFRRSVVLQGGRAVAGAAAIAVVRTRCRVDVFRHDHFRPTAERMVVTAADPADRLVSELNAEPAAHEYARIVGKDPAQLTPFTFAANPVVVRIGGEHHVRAIQKVEPDGSLRFFSAIDEGLVLRVAEPLEMATHLEDALAGLGTGREAPASILMCDCVLRRLEAEERQQTRAVSAVLRRHGVRGFSTYGEQHLGVHVNQTFTGVAIYPPER